MDKLFLINSIYLATEGEGVRIGTPQVFVRFQGCPIGCVNCDSKDTWDFAAGQTLRLEQVLEQIHKQSPLVKRVSITGGDPLHPKHEAQVLELCKALKERGYFINIEASGTRVVNSVFDLVDYISFDYKTLSTGVKTSPELILKLAQQFAGKFQVKSVVETANDFTASLEALEYVTSVLGKASFPWCLTPAYNLGESFPRERFLMVIELNEKAGGPFRVIGQQHKWFYGPDQKQV